MRAAVVCGYGIERDSRQMRYVANAARLLNAFEPDAIVLTGGASAGPAFPSEATVLADALLQSLPHATFVLDEYALKTLDNLRAAQHLHGMHERAELLLICDRVRAAKVWLLAHVLLHGSAWRIAALDRPEPIRTWIVQAASIPAQLLGAFIPAVGDYLHARRERQVARRAYGRHRD